MKVNYIAVVVAAAIGVTAGVYLKPAPPPAAITQSPTSESAKRIPIAAVGSVNSMDDSQTDTPVSLNSLLASDDLYLRLKIAQKLAQNADEGQIDSLLNELVTSESNENMTSALRVLFLHYASLNPVAALQRFDALLPTPSEAQRDILFALYHYYATLDITGLLHYMEAMDKNAQSALLHYLIADRHFNQNADLLAKAESFSPKMAFHVAKVTGLSNDILFDRLFTLGLDDRTLSNEMVALIKQWVNDDPAQAFNKIEALLKQNDHHSRMAHYWMQKLVGWWAEKSPEDALAAVLADPSSTDEAQTILRRVANDSPLKALQIYQQHKEVLGLEARNAVFRHWLGADAQSAAAYIAQMPTQEQISLLKSYPVARKYAHAMPMEAFKLAQELKLFNSQGRAYAFANALVQQDLAQAQDFWQNLDDSKAKNRLFAQITKRLARENIEQAQQWLKDHPEQSARNDEAVVFMVNQWAHKEPEKAARFAIGLENKQASAKAFTTSVNRWHRQSPQAAIDYVLSLPADSTKDMALMNLLHQVKHEDESLAKKLIDAMSNKNLREHHIKEMDW